jgi:hypothetical protein
VKGPQNQIHVAISQVQKSFKLKFPLLSIIFNPPNKYTFINYTKQVFVICNSPYIFNI